MYRKLDDEVFAKFLNYMQKALWHKKINYIRDCKRTNDMECRLDGLENALQSEDQMNLETGKFLKPKEQLVLKLYFKDRFTYKEIGKILNLQPESVRKLKYRALQKLERRKYYND